MTLMTKMTITTLTTCLCWTPFFGQGKLSFFCITTKKGEMNFMNKPFQKILPKLKLQIAIEALKGESTLIQLASQHGINPRQILRWRDQLLNEGDSVFKDKRSKSVSDPDKEELLKIIEQHHIELEFLKKKLKQFR